MIIVTGAAGFIGSCLTGALQSRGFHELLLVDDFSRPDKLKNLEGKAGAHRIHRDQLWDWLEVNQPSVDFVFHLGARTDTTEFNMDIFRELNIRYSQRIWEYCTARQVPLVYASSAATYGGGELGYRDDHALVSRLQPLNPYGISKNEVDKWILLQAEHATPPRWYGLKFFNVYGPNEYHKGRMASVVYHAFHQVRTNGHLNLFRSHRSDYADGMQLRDFIYVKDILSICLHLLDHAPASGIYNAGTGKARSFLDLAHAVFAALDREPDIRFIDMPEDIRHTYQYFTEADMQKLMQAGYAHSFRSLEDGAQDYVRHYLQPDRYY